MIKYTTYTDENDTITHCIRSGGRSFEIAVDPIDPGIIVFMTHKDTHFQSFLSEKFNALPDGEQEERAISFAVDALSLGSHEFWLKHEKFLTE